VGGAIGPDDAGPVEHEGDRQFLDPHVMDQLVIGPLQEGAVDGDHGPQAIAGHARRQGDGVLFGDAHVDALVRNGLLQQIEARARRHRRRDADHAPVLLAELDEGLSEDLAVAGGFGTLGGKGLAARQVEGGLGVVTHLVGFGVGITLALGGGHVHQHRPLAAVGLLEGAHHGGDVVAVDGAHVGETQLFEHRAHLGHRQPAHALLEAAQLGGDLAVEEGQMAHGLLGAVGKELHRRAQPHAVQMVRQGPHRW